MIKYNNKLRVYGDRLCNSCKGLCHENSYRTKHGLRRKYYCCKEHVENNKRAIKALEVGISIDFVMKTCFEKVDVLTKQEG